MKEEEKPAEQQVFMSHKMEKTSADTHVSFILQGGSTP